MQTLLPCSLARIGRNCRPTRHEKLAEMQSVLASSVTRQAAALQRRSRAGRTSGFRAAVSRTMSSSGSTQSALLPACMRKPSRNLSSPSSIHAGDAGSGLGNRPFATFGNAISVIAAAFTGTDTRGRIEPRFADSACRIAGDRGRCTVMIKQARWASAAGLDDANYL